MQKIKYITGFAGYVYSTLKNTDRYFTRRLRLLFPAALIAPASTNFELFQRLHAGDRPFFVSPYMPAYDGKQKSQQQSQQRGAVEDPPSSNPNLPPAMIQAWVPALAGLIPQPVSAG
jgi:hypothetical protein